MQDPDRLATHVCNPNTLSHMKSRGTLLMRNAGEVTRFPLSYLLFWRHHLAEKSCCFFLHALIFVVFNFLLGLFLAHFSSRFSSSSVMALAKSCMLASAQPSLLLAYRSSHSRWGLFRSYSGLCHFVKLLSGMWTWSKPRLSGICRMVPKTWMPVSKKHTSWFCSHGNRDSFGHAGTVPAAPQFPVHGNAWGWGWQGSQQHEWHTAIRTSISRCFMPSQPVQLYQGIRHLRSPLKLS